MTEKRFLFEEGAVGIFRSWRWPKREGLYKYLPLRTTAHLNMHRQLREQGEARCVYTRDNQRVWFSVVEFPRYSYLRLARFAVEELPK
jgi:hypothetical protein